jgi:uncharacterized membrane protein YhiD involved in acid resistance
LRSEGERLKLNPRRNKEVLTLLIVFTAVLVVSAFAVYFVGNRRSVPTTTPPEVTRPETRTAQPNNEPILPTERRSTVQVNRENESFLDRLFGTSADQPQALGEQWAEKMGKIALRLLLAALLGAALAFRPRKRILAIKRNPYVSQTQILLAIVAAALMIIVGDNAARAFGIFAAVSLVRFRTNIKDPKEITVLLISLALGLAAGVGRWDLAVILAGFALIVLWLLEWHEPQVVFRSMEVKVTTRNVPATKRALSEVFRKYGFDAELRGVDREATEDSPGSLVYLVDVSPTVTTDEMSNKILSLDGQHVEGIEWDQKKSYSYLYQ